MRRSVDCWHRRISRRGRRSRGGRATGLLDPAGGRGGLVRGLGGEMIAVRLATGGLAGGLLGTGHCFLFEDENTRAPSIYGKQKMGKAPLGGASYLGPS